MSDEPRPLPYVYYALVVDGEVASNFKVPVGMEAMVAAMSSDPTCTLNVETESFCEYNLTVDNEVAIAFEWSKADPMLTAIFQSSPTVIQLTDEHLEIGVGPGWLWDGAEFTEAS